MINHQYQRKQKEIYLTNNKLLILAVDSIRYPAEAISETKREIELKEKRKKDLDMKGGREREITNDNLQLLASHSVWLWPEVVVLGHDFAVLHHTLQFIDHLISYLQFTSSKKTLDYLQLIIWYQRLQISCVPR